MPLKPRDHQLKTTPFIAGDQLTLADLYLLVSLHWQGAIAKPLTETSVQLTRYKSQMYEIETIQRLFNQEFHRS